MSTITRDLSGIRAVLFDVDGVLSHQTISLDPHGEPVRTTNVRDGYAIANASKRGLTLGIITGGRGEHTRQRYSALGIQHIYMWANIKLPLLHDFCEKTGIAPEEIIYCGDDIPDVPVMKAVGIAVAPADAVPEVKAIADYICVTKGGDGVAREVLEQVMKAQGLWMNDEGAFGW